MKPQELELNCELFNEYRDALDAAIKNCVRQLVLKGLDAGTVTGKIEIKLNQAADANGEVIFYPEIEPEVTLKIGAKGKIDCGKKQGFAMKCAGGNFIVGTDQVTMDELIAGQEG